MGIEFQKVMAGVGIAAFTGVNGIACLGDSMMSISSASLTSPPRLSYPDRGVLGWAAALSGQRVRFNHNLNFGVAGENIAQVMARVPSVIASGARLCVVNPGTNDLPAGTALATMKSGYLAGITALLQAGVRVLVVPILPRNDTGWNALSSGARATARRVRDAFNRWLWELCFTTPGLEWVDILDLFTDLQTSSQDNPAGSGRSVFTYDGLHPSSLGAFWMGKAIADVVNRIVSPARYPSNPFAAFHLSENPSGNMFANPMLVGSQAAAGAGMSGNVAPSWAIGRYGGSSITAVGSLSAKTLPSGLTYNMQQVVMNNPGAGQELVAIRQYLTVAPLYTPGTATLFSECDIEIDAASGLIGAFIEMNEDNAGTLNQARSIAVQDTSTGCPLLPAIAMDMRHRSHPIASVAGAINLQWQVVFRLEPGATITARIGRPSVWAQ